MPCGTHFIAGTLTVILYEKENRHKNKMEANSNSIGYAVALKQEVLGKINEILSKEKENITVTGNGATKASFEKKLKRASIRYSVMRPLTIAMGVLFTFLCLTQIMDIDFLQSYFKWQNGALFTLLTLSLTVNVFYLKQKMERYKLLIYLFEMVERIEKIK